MWIILLIVYAVFYICALVFLYYYKGIYRWLPGYGERLLKRRHSGTVHLLVATANIFDPGSGRVSVEEEDRRLFLWERRMGDFAAQYRDADGRPPLQTWFVPVNRLSEETIYKISRMCFNGLGEMELCFSGGSGVDRTMLDRFMTLLSAYGACVYYDAQSQKKRSFSAIIDNRGAYIPVTERFRQYDNLASSIDSKECFADFSLIDTGEIGSRFFNRAYYYIQHKNGTSTALDPYIPVFQGSAASNDFMIVPGAIGVNWFDWRNIFFPRIDYGILSNYFLPHVLRMGLWVRTAVSIPGKPEWRVIKLFTRGCDPGSEEAMLGKYARNMYETFGKRYNDGKRYCLHYVTCRELYNIIKAAESGCSGDPDSFRDWKLPSPVNKNIFCTVPFETVNVTPEDIVINIVKDTHATVCLNNFPIIECSGWFSKIELHARHTYKQLRLVLYGRSEARIKGVLTGVPLQISGATITSIHPAGDGKHAIELQTNINARQEITLQIN